MIGGTLKKALNQVKFAKRVQVGALLIHTFIVGLNPCE
jgi:hypothetical protein